MRSLEFDAAGFEDLAWWVAQDRKKALKLIKLIEEIQRPLVLRGRQVFLGASVGITLFPFDASSAGQLLKNADIAMYQAKVAGKGCYRFYSKAMDQAVERRVQLEEELRGAWDRGELSLAYQPIYRLADRRLMGAEALCRWQHPRLGVVPPSVFIEVAEQSGLIESLGRDELVGSLFLLYNLHPLDLDTRVRQALDRVRASLQLNGSDIELLGIVEGMVRLRVQEPADGGSLSMSSIRRAIEEAIYQMAPDVQSLEIEEGRSPLQDGQPRIGLPLVRG